MDYIADKKINGTPIFKNSKIANSPFLTCQEVAKYLRKSDGAIRNLVYRKQITAYKINRRLLFKKTEVDRWVEKYRVGNEFGY